MLTLGVNFFLYSFVACLPVRGMRIYRWSPHFFVGMWLHNPNIRNIMEQQAELLTEWVEDSIGTYLYQKRPKRRIIYLTMLAVVTTAIVSLPFVYVDITVQSSGFVRPNGEISVITAPMTETVERVSAKEGDKLRRGDEILRFRTSAPDGKIKYQQERSKEANAHIADLELLSRGQRPQAFA